MLRPSSLAYLSSICSFVQSCGALAAVGQGRAPKLPFPGTERLPKWQHVPRPAPHCSHEAPGVCVSGHCIASAWSWVEDGKLHSRLVRRMTDDAHPAWALTRDSAWHWGCLHSKHPCLGSFTGSARSRGNGLLLDCISQLVTLRAPSSVLLLFPGLGISSRQMCRHGDRSAFSFLGHPLRPAPPRLPSPHGSELGSWTLRQGLPSSLQGVWVRKEGSVGRKRQ